MNFNVLEKPWIPVIYLNGMRKMVSLRTVLSEAHQIERLDTLNVMEEYGVYRFLILFMTCVHRPVALKQVLQICKTGKFDMDKVEEYIRLCESEGVSFDIYDKTRPFLQTPYSSVYDFPIIKDMPKKLCFIGCIDPSLPHGNNKPHFGNVFEKDSKATVDKAVRLLIAYPIFCTAMGGTYPSYVTGAPSLYYLYNGRNLFETVAYSIVVLNVDNRDLPAEKLERWRNTSPIVPAKEVVDISILQALLFPTRRILLSQPEADGFIHTCLLSPGLNYKTTYYDDPFVVYKYQDKKEAGYKVSLKPKVEKSLWRHIATLYASNLMDTRAGGRNGTLDILKSQYGTLCKKLNNTTLVPLRMYGVATNQGKYLDMQYGEYTLDSRIVEHPQLIDEVTAGWMSWNKLPKS